MAIVDKSLFRATPVPRPRRRKVLAPVVLTREDGSTCSVVVENVSASGVLARCAQGAPPVGAQVRIALPDIAPLWGVVRWVEDARFGIEVDPRSAAAPGAAGGEAGEPGSDANEAPPAHPSPPPRRLGG
ncbi:signal transduction protein [Novosphingobium huizhouense]|uniref:signal transduction protein n=1 Tax=Novosphingobium huizhouense TaxID=2866625 RepID=UPI001CD8E74D|nr:signal transduction protein [Novosphingobium huizhouense]